MLRKILKVIGWVAGGIAGCAVLLYLLVVAVNWRDAEPSEAAVRLADLHRNRPAVADEDNAFVYLMGFDVAPHADPRQTGMKRIAWSVETKGPDPQVVRREQWPQREATVREFIETCRSVTAGCVAAFQRNKRVLENWVGSEQWLLDRYQALLAHSGWRETVPSSAEAVLPAYTPALDGQKLLMVQASSLAQRGDSAGVQQAGKTRFHPDRCTTSAAPCWPASAKWTTAITRVVSPISKDFAVRRLRR